MITIRITTSATAVLVVVAMLAGGGFQRAPEYVSVIGLVHVGLGAFLGFKQRGDSPVQWLALAMVLLGTRLASGMIGDWDSLGTGLFSISESLSPVAVGALLAFARTFAAGQESHAPWPSKLHVLDRWSVLIGVMIAVHYLWDPGVLDPEALFIPWEVYALVRTLQYVRTNYLGAQQDDRLRLKWLVLACLIWLFAPLPLFLQALDFPGRAALGLSGVVVLIGSAVLTYGILVRGTLDPQLAIRRTVVFGLLGMLLLVAFAAFETVLADLVLRSIGVATQWATLVAGASIALVAKPVYQRVEERAGTFVDESMAATMLRDAPEQSGSVVFCDLVGFTALTEQDRRVALTAAGLLHGTASQTARSNSGRVVKTIGDAVLMVFDGPDAAVGAATQLVRAYQDSAASEGIEDVPVRVGVASGVFQVGRSGDVFGSVVNLAARLEALAVPGSIVMDRASVENGDLVDRTTPMGGRHVRGFEKPIECFVIESLA